MPTTQTPQGIALLLPFTVLAIFIGIIIFGVKLFIKQKKEGKVSFSWKRFLTYFIIFYGLKALADYFVFSSHTIDARVAAISASFFVSILLWIIFQTGFYELLLASLLSCGGEGLSGCFASFLFSIPLVLLLKKLRFLFQFYFQKTDTDSGS